MGDESSHLTNNDKTIDEVSKDGSGERTDFDLKEFKEILPPA